MPNEELNYLLKVYWQIKDELEMLMGDYEINNVKVKLFKQLEGLMGDKLKTVDMLDRVFWKSIFDGMFYREYQETLAQDRELFKKISSPETKMKIDYLELKLDAVKQLLGEDNFKELEKYERENILGKNK